MGKLKINKHQLPLRTYVAAINNAVVKLLNSDLAAFIYRNI